MISTWNKRSKKNKQHLQVCSTGELKNRHYSFWFYNEIIVRKDANKVELLKFNKQSSLLTILGYTKTDHTKRNYSSENYDNIKGTDEEHLKSDFVDRSTVNRKRQRFTWFRIRWTS